MTTSLCVFAQSDKENRCCVCGRRGNYLRHNVVPYCYRSLFPLSMKSHLSHDIVLLCQECQQVMSGVFGILLDPAVPLLSSLV